MQGDVLAQNREQIREIQDLPPLSVIAEKILLEFSKEYTNIAQLSSVIEQDPGLLARIIGIANSSYFGCQDKIYTVSDAIIKVLGLNMVKSLALGIVLSSPLRSVQCPGFQLDKYWFSTMQTAGLARQLAPYIGLNNVHLEDHVYLCGLMHNIGLLVLAHSFPSQMSSVFSETSFKDLRTCCQLQRDAVGMTYMEAGTILANKWHLPDEVIAVTEYHMDSDYRGDYWEMSALVGLSANLVANDYLGGDWDNESDRYISALQIESDVIQKVSEIVQTARQETIDMARVLAMD